MPVIKVATLCTACRHLGLPVPSKKKLVAKLACEVLSLRPPVGAEAVNDAIRRYCDHFKLKNTKSTAASRQEFYTSREWLAVRYKAITTYGRKCMCCCTTSADVQYHVDHIKPRSRYPELELDFENLQILCADCNMGKSNVDSTDWRPH